VIQSGPQRAGAVALLHHGHVSTLERAWNRPRERTLVEVSGWTATSYPEQPAVDDWHVVLTYSDLMSQLRRTRSGEVSARCPIMVFRSIREVRKARRSSTCRSPSNPPRSVSSS